MKRDYGKISHPGEAARADYITRLVRLSEEATRTSDYTWQAIDAEIKQHPAPNDSNNNVLSILLVGKSANGNRHVTIISIGQTEPGRCYRLTQT